MIMMMMAMMMMMMIIIIMIIETTGRLCSLLFDWYRGPFPELRWPERDIYSHPRNAEVKNKWSYTSSPRTSICLDGVEREKFTYIKIIVVVIKLN